MEKKCTIHTLNPTITDSDLSALFDGLLDVVKKKYELDYSARIINLNKRIEILTRLVKQKEEELLSLKAKLSTSSNI